MTVVIAGGGTGGHLYPGLAVAEALVARGVAVTFVGTAGGIEVRVVPGVGYPLKLLPGRQLRGGGPGRFVVGLAATAGG
ncbi:MAG TPA: glycosyltransferase, partial [Candidatus Binatia bacterium]|nr:glycosyltransferase [Candidatus Binatia bacterium]